jgi:hypothetical protein
MRPDLRAALSEPPNRTVSHGGLSAITDEDAALPVLVGVHSGHSRSSYYQARWQGGAVRYALLISSDESAPISAEEDSARVAAYTAFTDEMHARGVLHDGGLRLQPTATATTVRIRQGDVVIADGPFAETKEQIAGFFLAECKDLDEALEVAAKIPGAAYGTIEVRPVWE